MTYRTLHITLAALGVALGCQSPVDPYPAVRSMIVVPTRTVMSGDAVIILVIAHNRGRSTLEVGYGCGAGLDLEVTEPNGTRRFPIRELPSICPVFDSNVLAPGETDSVSMRWVAPPLKGTYRVRGGLRVEKGLGAPSAAVPLTVH